jgi:predicted dehydrogenase
MSEVGFLTMSAKGGDEHSPPIGIGMLGYGFMGKAYCNALHKIRYITWPPPLDPKLVTVAGRDADAVSAAARRYGFERSTTDWREVVEDPEVELFVNLGPNAMHAEPVIAAAEAGKHIMCEKPLGRDADESHRMWAAATKAGVTNVCGFNYRFVPAVRLAREMLEAGELGEIYHFRGRFLQEWIADPAFPMVWRLDKAAAGSGVVGDLGSHIVDLARYLVGEIETVTGNTKTFVTERDGKPVDVDDAFSASVEFAGGAVGTLEASRFCLGRKADLGFEINGSKGSIAFDLARLNELQVHFAGSRPGPSAQGFRTVSVTESDHPFWDHWWPHGHVIGWEHTFVDELHHVLTAIAGKGELAPHAATFEDGYRAAEICDAILRSGATGSRELVEFRDVAPQPSETTE